MNIPDISAFHEISDAHGCADAGRLRNAELRQPANRMGGETGRAGAGPANAPHRRIDGPPVVLANYPGARTKVLPESIVPDWTGYLRFRPQFEQVTDPQFYPIEWLDAQVLKGRAWPIVGRAAALVVEVRQYPGGVRAAHGLIAAGNLSEIVNELIPRAEAWGRAQGCKFGLIESREGWAKVLKKHGWGTHQVALLKEL